MNEGIIVSDFIYDSSEAVQKAYNTDNESLALVRTEEGTALYTETTNELQLISGKKDGEAIDLEKNNISILQGEKDKYICVDTDESDETEEKENICLDDYEVSNELIDEHIQDEQKNVKKDFNVLSQKLNKFEIQKASTCFKKKHLLFPNFVSNSKNGMGICLAVHSDS